MFLYLRYRKKNLMNKLVILTYRGGTFRLHIALILVVMLIVSSCKDEGEKDLGLPLPILTLKGKTATSDSQYLGNIEGIVNVEIRPQVDGILEEIYVDEGDFVEKNKPLFKVNEQPYVEELKNAHANVQLEKAKLEKAKTEIKRLQPLIENQVISDVRLQTAQADYDVAKSSLEKAQANEASMKINLAFTEIKAPVSGVIGRIPKKIGNLVKKSDTEPLTILSDVHQVYVYFSMSESDYLFYERMKNDSTSKKLNPNVKLILADGSTYKYSGIIDANAGQIDPSTGSITLRAKFNNPDTLLRTGNAGKIVMQQIYPDVILIPQGATVFIQDKKFVFALKKDNTVRRVEVDIEGTSGKYYIIKKSKKLTEGDRIVISGLDKLTNGTKVSPMPKNAFLAE